MKVDLKKMELDMKWITKLGLTGNMLLCYGLIMNSDRVLTNTEVAIALSITFPTAQKCLHRLADDGLISESDKGYTKI